MYSAYVLKSQKNGTYYFGHSNDLDTRVKHHNAGKARYTKRFRPWKLIYFEEFESKSEAFKREMFFKTLPGRNFLKQTGVIS